MDRGESTWLEALARFDRDQGWAVDGQLSCVEWLVFRTGMGRATAFEKLRIAHQLWARPVVAAAFADGRLSYSAVRAITRIDDPDIEVDQALVELAMAGTVVDVERAVRCYQRHADQHRAPADVESRRGVRIQRGFDGTGRVEIILSDVELEEFAAVLQAFVDVGSRPVTETSAEAPDPSGESPRGDSPADDTRASVESPHGDSATGVGYQSWPSRQADALMDMVRVGLAHVDDGQAAGDDRYLVHVIAGPDGASLVDGTPLHPATAATVGCDAAHVTHTVGEGGELLALGRKTRKWSTAQRRATMVRDGGTCRFPGCWRRRADLHHQQFWTDGGRTDIDNGFLVCRRHHALLHNGYRAIGNPNIRLRFHRPDGTPIGTTTPRSRGCARPPGG
ncbi:MAG: DUF222 domain-containing protein [Acidimicrobiales bacterium]